MKDVAALAGVSLKTVSRVINEEPWVSEDVIAKVRKAAEQLDYRPNLTASNLRRSGGKTLSIGVLLEDVGNPFSAGVHRGIENVARERGVVVISGSVDEDGDREKELVEAFTARRVDGLIIAPASRDQSYLFNEMRAGVQVVFVDRAPTLVEADAVLVDNVAGARDGVSHLIAHGHKDIAFLGDLTSIVTARQRFEGYVAAMESAGLSVNPARAIHDLHTPEAAEQATLELMSAPNGPTALFTGQNLITIGACRALRRLKLQHEIALVGFDEIPLADLLDPALSHVAQDPVVIGEQAARRLFARIEGDRSPARNIVIPTSVVANGSGELPPAP